ncbi:MAG: DUF2085 domain-containing protein [Chloroflexota bacterium]|nr:DUF2085 domain-containing protein [Chloroflexota bacterium]
MDKPQKSQPKSPIWRWVLLSLAVLLTITWLFLTPEGLLGKANAVGYAVCHRIPERSFNIGGREMAMCARCSGLFLGALLGLIFQILQGRKGKMPPFPAALLFGLLALAWVLDGINSFSMLTPSIPSFYQTQNWTRLVTGTGMGLAISAILLPAFIQTMFKGWEGSSSFDRWYQIVMVLILAAILDALILLEIPAIQYLLSLLSAAGVLVLLTMIYSMVLVMLFKKENTYQSVSQLFMPFVGGFIIALIQIGVIDLFRYLLTGTWDGFNIAILSTIIMI